MNDRRPRASVSGNQDCKWRLNSRLAFLPFSVMTRTPGTELESRLNAGPYDRETWTELLESKNLRRKL